MNPGIRWKENGAVIKTMNDNFQEIELFPMKIGDKNSPRTAKVTRHSEISSVFQSVDAVERFWQPSSHRRLDSSPRIGYCKRNKQSKFEETGSIKFIHENSNQRKMLRKDRLGVQRSMTKNWRQKVELYNKGVFIW